MKVNLKKAAALAAALSSTAIKVDHSYSVDVYGELPTADGLKAAKEVFETQVSNNLVVLTAAYTIRRLIGDANAATVDKLLNLRALTEKKLAFLNALPLRRQDTNLDVLKKKVEAVLAGDQKIGYGGPRVPDLEIGTEEFLTPLIKKLKKLKRDLDEELQAVNFNTTIEIPEDVVKVLTDLDLI